MKIEITNLQDLNNEPRPKTPGGAAAAEAGVCSGACAGTPRAQAASASHTDSSLINNNTCSIMRYIPAEGFPYNCYSYYTGAMKCDITAGKQQ